MSAEKLKGLVETGNLIDLNIMSDSLTSLLNEIATVLVDQQRQLAQLRKDLGDSVSREDFLAFKGEWRMDRDTIMRSIPDFDSELRQSRTYLDSRVAALKTSVDESVSAVLISVDHRIAQKVDPVQADLLLLHRAVASVRRQWLSAQATPPAVASEAPPDESAPAPDESDGPPDGFAVVASTPDGKEETDERKPADEEEAASERIVSDGAPNLSGRVGRLEAEFDSFIGGATSQSLLETIRKEVRDQLATMAPSRGQFPDHAAEDSAFIHTPDEAEMCHFAEEFEAIQRFGAPAPPAAPSELDEIRHALSEMDAGFQERLAELIGRVERKSEITLVERMFEKLRVIVASVKDDLTVVEGQVEKLVKRIEMESYVETSLSSLLDEEQTATSNKHLKCLACGRPRLKASAADAWTAKSSELPALPPITSPTKRYLRG
jgi:hypothetical protein